MPPNPRTNTTVDGLVLRVHPSGDSDLVIRILTPTIGKLSIIAKQARKGGKRFSGTIDTFDCGRFEFRAGRSSLALLQGFIPTQNFTGLRSSLDKIAAGSLLCEIADYLTIEESGEELFPFESLRGGLKALEQSKSRAELLSITYEHAALQMQSAGFLDAENFSAGSTKKLRNLLNHIEQCVERKLATRSAFEDILHAFAKQMPPPKPVEP